MANPARDLLRFFHEIQGVGSATGTDARDMGSSSDGAKAAVLLQTGAILEGTIRCIRQLKSQGRRVTKFESMIPTWTFGVFSYPLGWASADVQPLYTDHSMDLLEVLADLVDDTLIVHEPDFIETVRDLLDEAEELLKHDESISYSLRSYLQQLFTETRQTLRDAELNVFDLQEAWKRLYAAFNGAAAQSSERSKWDQFLAKFVWPTAAGAAGSLPGTIVSITQITTGSN